MPTCPYNSPIKCKIYNEWLNRRKFITGLPRAYEELFLDEGEI